MGNQTFRAVIHQGGLPDAGWDKSERVEIESTLGDSLVDFTRGEWKI